MYEGARRFAQNHFGKLVFAYVAFYYLFCLLCLLPLTSYDAELHKIMAAKLEYGWPRGSQVSVFSQLVPWDVAAYLKIAADGYKRDSPLCAYYPLWPALLSPFVHLFPAPIALSCGYLLNTALLLLGLRQFRELASETAGPQIARWATVLLLSLPGSIAYFTLYTESLFLLLSVLFFRYLTSGRALGLVIVSLLLPLCKAVGIFIAVPLMLCIAMRKNPIPASLGLAAAILGYLTYFGVMKYFTGNPFEGFVAQEFYANQPSIANILNIPQFLSAFMEVGPVFHPTAGLLDRILFVTFLAFLPFAWRLSTLQGSYATCIGIVPAMSNVFLSYTRFFSSCFPVVTAIAWLLIRTDHPRLLGAVIAVSWCLQCVAMYRLLSLQWAI